MEPDKGKSNFDEIEKWLSTDYIWTRLYLDDHMKLCSKCCHHLLKISFFSLQSLNENRSLEFGTSTLQHMRKQKTKFSLQSLVIVFPVCMIKSKHNDLNGLH